MYDVKIRAPDHLDPQYFNFLDPGTDSHKYGDPWIRVQKERTLITE